jgi:hypothetical protein
LIVRDVPSITQLEPAAKDKADEKTGLAVRAIERTEAEAPPIWIWFTIWILPVMLIGSEEEIIPVPSKFVLKTIGSCKIKFPLKIKALLLWTIPEDVGLIVIAPLNIGRVFGEISNGPITMVSGGTTVTEALNVSLSLTVQVFVP